MLFCHFWFESPKVIATSKFAPSLEETNFFFWLFDLESQSSHYVKMFVDWTSLTSGLSFNHSKYFLAISGNLLKKDKVWAELRKHFKWGNVFSFFSKYFETSSSKLVLSWNLLLKRYDWLGVNRKKTNVLGKRERDE